MGSEPFPWTAVSNAVSITKLEAQKLLALGSGYSDAFSSCQNISQSYIAELSKPRFSSGSTLGLCLGTAGAGVLVETMLRR